MSRHIWMYIYIYTFGNISSQAPGTPSKISHEATGKKLLGNTPPLREHLQYLYRKWKQKWKGRNSAVKWTCHLKRDHLERKFTSYTASIFKGCVSFSRGIVQSPPHRQLILGFRFWSRRVANWPQWLPFVEASNKNPAHKKDGKKGRHFLCGFKPNEI